MPLMTLSAGVTPFVGHGAENHQLSSLESVKVHFHMLPTLRTDALMDGTDVYMSTGLRYIAVQ